MRSSPPRSSTPSGSTSSPTKFVSTVRGSTGRPASASPSARRLARAILSQAVDVMIERVQRACGNHPGLTHRSAEEELRAPRLAHRLPRPREHSAERAAETLREAERDGVGHAPVLGGRHAARNRGKAEQRRAVQVDDEAELPRGPATPASSSRSQTRPPAPRCVCSSTTTLGGCRSSEIRTTSRS